MSDGTKFHRNEFLTQKNTRMQSCKKEILTQIQFLTLKGKKERLYYYACSSVTCFK